MMVLPEMAITGHTLEELHDWLYAQLTDNMPRADLRFLAGVPKSEPPYRRFGTGAHLFGVLVV